MKDKAEQVELQAASFEADNEFVRSATEKEWQDYLGALVEGRSYFEAKTTPRKRTLSSTIEPADKKKQRVLTKKPEVKSMKTTGVSRGVPVH